MKTTKRIFAAFLAVMLLALMIPVAASADSYTATITGKEGYTITVYKIASFDGAETYTPVSGIAAGISAELAKKPIVPADLLTACETAKNAGQNTGTASGSPLTFGSNAKATFTTAEAGVYYATVTATPAGVSVKKTGGAVFYLSDAKDANNNSMATQNIDMSAKIEDGTVTVTKTLENSDIDTTKGTYHVGDEITFKLTASVTGTKEEYLKSYVIHDSMSNGLDFVRVESVKLDGTTALTASTDYAVDSANKSDIKISLSQAYLNAAKAGTNGFYNASNVVVLLIGKLNANAVHGRVSGDEATAYSDTTANYNKDSLSFTNKQDIESTVEGKTVHVYTYDVPVIKVDATNESTKLKDATFELKGQGKTYTATTGDDGIASFTGVQKGTYTLKETVAPKGYNLNTTEYTVVIAADGTITQNATVVTQVKVGNTPVVMPATGGPGTMIFTIIGVSLIACAGVLLVIVKRKRSK